MYIYIYIYIYIHSFQTVHLPNHPITTTPPYHITTTPPYHITPTPQPPFGSQGLHQWACLPSTAGTFPSSPTRISEPPTPPIEPGMGVVSVDGAAWCWIYVVCFDGWYHNPRCLAPRLLVLALHKL